MQAAVERAELVSGVSGVFLNLARRSQVLVHRQLALLDAMERRIEEPDHLEDLFRLDHLATRMRAARRGPDHPVRRDAGPRLAAPGGPDRRGARRRRRGRGLSAGRGAPDAAGPGTRPGRGRPDAPAGRADRERHLFLAAAHPRRGRRRAGRLRLRDRDRGPRPRHEPGGAARGQPADRRVQRRRPVRQRPARPVRGLPAGPAARDPGQPVRLGVRRDHGRGAHPERRDAEPRRVRRRAGGAERARRRAADRRSARARSRGPGLPAPAAHAGARPAAAGRGKRCASRTPTGTRASPRPRGRRPSTGSAARPPACRPAGDLGARTLGPDGLPRRVRQANLAPQLRADPPPRPSADPRRTAEDRPRSRGRRVRRSSTGPRCPRSSAVSPAAGPTAPPTTQIPARADAAADEHDARGEDAR